jgi:purine nucleosidase/pyrimidine-specific ribonucleoside hydrolase
MMLTAKGAKHIILDVDPGVDDALAIILALRSDALHVEAITTVAGNVPVEQGTKNLLRVLALLDRRVDIAQGCDRPFVEAPFGGPSMHGEDGLGDLGDAYYPPLDRSLLLPTGGGDLIIQKIETYPDDLTLVATGPLTNVATAMRKAPDTMRRLREIVLMGGAVLVPGNIPPGAAEFNIWADPHAAEVVLDFGLPVTMVGLDVTRQVGLTRARVTEELETKTGCIPRFVYDAVQRYMDSYRERQGFDGCYLHDPLAVGMAIDPSYVRTEEMRVYVETEGKVTRGMTLPSRHPTVRREPPNVRVCVEVDHERFLGDFLRIICGEK